MVALLWYNAIVEEVKRVREYRALFCCAEPRKGGEEKWKNVPNAEPTCGLKAGASL